MIPVVRLEAMPSIGVLTRGRSLSDLDRDEDRTDYIRSCFSQRGGDSYFGSKFDRYAESFGRHIRAFADTAARADRALRDALSLFSDEDIIRPCTTLKSLRTLPPCMYKSILSMPVLYDLFREGRVQGWGELTYEDIKGEDKRYKRLLETNGSMTIMPGYEDPEQEDTLTWVWKTDDPDLTAQQIEDIRATRQYIEDLMATTQLDPTDLDMIRS